MRDLSKQRGEPEWVMFSTDPEAAGLRALLSARAAQAILTETPYRQFVLLLSPANIYDPETGELLGPADKPLTNDEVEATIRGKIRDVVDQKIRERFANPGKSEDRWFRLSRQERRELNRVLNNWNVGWNAAVKHHWTTERRLKDYPETILEQQPPDPFEPPFVPVEAGGQPLSDGENDQRIETCGPVPKPDGWTRGELIAQANHDDGDGSSTLSGTTFDRIREAAGIPAAEKGGVGAQRRFSVAQLRQLIDAAEAGTYRNGSNIAAAWRELLPS